MRDRLQAWSRMALERWKNLTRAQKLKVGGIAAAVLIALVLALFLAFRTNWQPAFTGVDHATAGQIQNVLGEANIASQADTVAGVVLVPAHLVDQAITTVYMSDVLWSPAYTFRDAMADMGMGTTFTMQHQALLRARESEVAEMLMRIDFISSADVGLTIPSVPSFLIQPTTPATASVTVGGTRILTPEDGQAVALVVSRMVEGLSFENVIVVDDNLNILFSDGQPGLSGTAGVAADMAAAIAFEFHTRQVLTNNIQQIFGPVNDEVHVALGLDFDWRIVNSVATVFESPLGDGERDGLRSWNELIDRAGVTTDTGPIGIPGIDTQGGMPGGDLFADEFGDGMTGIREREERANHLHNMTETVHSWGHIPGEFLRPTSSVAITLTDHNIFEQARETELGSLGELTWTQWQAEMGNGSIIIPENLEALIAHVSMATGIPIPSISIIMQQRNHFIDEEITPLPLVEIILLSLVLLFVGLLAFLLIRRTAPEIIEEIEPELSVEDMLVSSKLEEERAAEIERLAEIQYAADSQVKEQIDKFAVEKPESVAQLLRNWINEDWE